MSRTFELSKTEDGGCVLNVNMGGLVLKLRVDVDSNATVEKCQWKSPNPYFGTAPEHRLAACRDCPHAKSIGKLTVQCALCGCGGLRLDGPASSCRAGKWNNESE